MNKSPRVRKTILLLSLSILLLPQPVLIGQDQVSEQTRKWLTALLNKESVAIQQLRKVPVEDCDYVLRELAEQEQLAPNDPDWPYYQGVVCERAHQFEQAIRHYARARELHPSLSVQIQMARCYDALNQWNEGIAELLPLFEKDPANLRVALTLAEYQYKKADPAAAVTTLKRTLESTPEGSAELFQQMGLCYRALRDEEAAVRCFEQAVTLNPQYVPAFFALARSFMRNGDQEKGMRIIKIACRFAQSASQPYYEIPLILHYSGETEVAEQRAQARLLRDLAAGANPNEALYTLAALYAQTGHGKRASYYLGEALKNGFNNFYRILQDPELDTLREESYFQGQLLSYWPVELEAFTPDFDKHNVADRTRPLFEGADANQFSIWVNRHLVYPQECKKLKIEGDVLVSFDILPDGTLSDPEVITSPHPALGEEALRVVQMSPKWTPATEDGEPVKYTFMFPVYFRLK